LQRDSEFQPLHPCRCAAAQGFLHFFNPCTGRRLQGLEKCRKCPWL
jgi:hypothetical protein